MIDIPIKSIGGTILELFWVKVSAIKRMISGVKYLNYL
jgi:hypothetical protein